MFAQTTLDWAAPIIQLATGGGFAALVWYLVVKHIPAIEDRHKEERTELFNYMATRDERQDLIAKEFTAELHNVRIALEKMVQREEK